MRQYANLCVQTDASLHIMHGLGVSVKQNRSTVQDSSLSICQVSYAFSGLIRLTLLSVLHGHFLKQLAVGLPPMNFFLPFLSVVSIIVVLLDKKYSQMAIWTTDCISGMGHIFEREKTLKNSCLLFILQCTLYNISSTNKLYACVPSLIMDPCRTAVSRCVCVCVCVR